MTCRLPYTLRILLLNLLSTNIISFILFFWFLASYIIYFISILWIIIMNRIFLFLSLMNNSSTNHIKSCLSFGNSLSIIIFLKTYILLFPHFTDFSFCYGFTFHTWIIKSFRTYKIILFFWNRFFIYMYFGIFTCEIYLTLWTLCFLSFSMGMNWWII